MSDHQETPRVSHDRESAYIHDAEAALRSEIAAVFARRATAEMLRGRVAALARSLRRSGLPPEAALVRVKDIVFNSSVSHFPVDERQGLSRREASIVGQRLVTWYIESYFAENAVLNDYVESREVSG